jgi:hypothetical protein
MLVLLVPTVWAAARYGGVTEVAWVVLGESVVAACALAWFARTRAGVSLGRQWQALSGVAFACPVAWIACRAVAEATADAVGVVQLCAPLAVGLLAYLAMIFLVDPQLPRHALGQARRMVGRAALAPS